MTSGIFIFINKFARFVCCTEFLFVLVFVFLFMVLRIPLFCLSLLFFRDGVPSSGILDRYLHSEKCRDSFNETIYHVRNLTLALRCVVV